ncbi:copper homeostasis periplasmic binding protein CopC [Sphingomonas oryzagri]|uniref:Copper homeostasis periplasmic binding protein CopC n=1 Tax=Sphingomonas oryzagri TaxID=3042314 RepID=A0ABT6MYZ0_9SPHN|nr:copper homeostasis periplasmic binding protein CopC [Sphingomonas oryzagri]MDH7638279.1 copper homeostasis periplasmic binding protein CopC [Sphingomonas oryzagri]
MYRKLAATCLAALAFTTAAQAHPKLLSTIPAAQSTDTKVRRIELHFSERLMPAFSGVDLVMTSMPGMKMAQPMQVALHSAVSPDGLTLTGTPDKPLSAGSYEVRYHVVSTDTHRVQAAYAFTVR